MKQNLKNEVDVVSLINQIQAQLGALDRKIDALINRPLPESRPAPRPYGEHVHSTPRHNDHQKGRMLYKAICTDCKKECGIPFKPSGGRPVYCQDCFSKRKVISLSGFKAEGNERQEEEFTSSPSIKSKKKTFAPKKPFGKKKPVPKKK